MRKSPLATSTATVAPCVAPKLAKAQAQNSQGSLKSLAVDAFVKLSWIDSQRDALEAVLADARGKEAFRSYLEAENASEGLAFLLAVDGLAKFGNDADAVAAAARDIVECYVLPGASHEVNLPSRLRKLPAVESEGPEAAAALQEHLQQGRKEVLRLLAADNFSRFLRSAHATHFLDALTTAPGPNEEEGASDGALRQQLVAATERTAELQGGWLGCLRAAADVLPACVTIVDMTLPGAPLVYVNAAFERMSGFSSAECVGRNCRFLQGPASELEAIQLIRDAMQHGTVAKIALTNYKKTGEAFVNLLALKPVFQVAAGAAVPAAGVHGTTTTTTTPRSDGSSPPISTTGGRSRVLRFFVGVQYEAITASMVPTRLLQLDALIKLLPSEITTE